MINNNYNLNYLDDISTGVINSTSSDYYQNYVLFLDMIDKIPNKELEKLGYQNNITSLYPLYQNIFDDKLKTLFRKSDSSNNSLSIVWLAKVTNDAKEKVFNEELLPFKGLNKTDLKQIAKLSKDTLSVLELPKILLKYGIILIYEQTLSSMKLDGAVFKLSSGHPVVAISFRYPRIDNFWFTLMHELSHIVLHFDQLDTPIIDDLDTESEDLIENQANRLARNSFIEKSIWRNCPPKYQTGDEIVYEFAKEIGIHPAVIAGLLRYEKKSYSIYSNIINKVNIRNKVFDNE